MRNSTETPQLNPNLTESEKEITEAVIKAKQLGEGVGDEFGIGMIDKSLPNALYNYLCYIISYSTGSNILTIKNEINLFDFVSFLYIISEVNKEKQGSMQNTPSGREEQELMGL